MCRLQHQLIKDGFFAPRGSVGRYDVVYDANAEVVRESCILRGENKSENVTNPPERLPTEIQTNAPYLDERLLFMGYWFLGEHHGHFLTEGMARYWYVMQDTERKWKIPVPKSHYGLLKSIVRAYRKRSGAHWKVVMRALGLSMGDFLLAPNVIQAREIIVPQCSMYHGHRIEMSHLHVTRKVARSIVGTSHIGHIPTPVYLSRTGMSKGISTYLDEEAVEEHCRQLGCRIVHPERMSLKQQVILFNTHDVFIGGIGSAFHTLLYRFVNRKAVNIYLAPQKANSNYTLIDDLMENESYYVRCVEPVSGARKTWRFDQERAIDGITGVLMRIQVNRTGNAIEKPVISKGNAFTKASDN